MTDWDNIVLQENERLDDLMRCGRKIIQNKDEFCFSLDAVLLAHFPRYKKRYKVLDLGTGTGVMPLIIADEVEKISAIELNKTMANLAARNVELNELTDKINVIEGDYREIKNIISPESFDLVLANPPYRRVSEGQISNLQGVANARHEFTATLKDVVKAGRYALRYHGVFSMIHLPERLGEIMAELVNNQLSPKRLRFILPKKDRQPNLMLVEAVQGGALGGLKILPPLVVHEDDGSYTEEILSIYGYE